MDLKKDDTNPQPSCDFALTVVGRKEELVTIDSLRAVRRTKVCRMGKAVNYFTRGVGAPNKVQQTRYMAAPS